MGASTFVEPLQVGEEVEVHGLESENGKLLNGKTGTLTVFLEDKGRWQVELAPDHVVSLKPANLQRVQQEQQEEEQQEEEEAPAEEKKEEQAEAPAPPAPKPDGDGTFKVGDRVEVQGLQSESGSKLNGQVGHITEYLVDKGRFQVQLEDADAVSIKPANLKSRSPAPFRPRKAKSPSPSKSSSSSSSSSKVRKPKRKTMFSDAPFEEPKKKKKKKDMTPEEILEAALNKENKKNKKSKKESRDASFDSEAAAAAAAAAARFAEAAASWAADVGPLKAGERVEVYGLQSEAGMKLNGKSGILTKFDQEKGRWQVELGMATIQSLKENNLRRVAAQSTAGSQPVFTENYAGPSAGYTML